MKMRAYGVVALVASGLLIGGTSSAFAQHTEKIRAKSPGGKDDPSPLVRAKTELVSLTITATDRSGRPVVGLQAKDIDIYEDDVRQTIEHYTELDAPVSIGVVFDVSGSMELNLDAARNALKSFLETCHVEDEIFLVGFHETASLMAEFSNGERLERRLKMAKAQGSTALYDGVYLGVEKILQGRHNRRALLIISDGRDNASRYTLNQLRQRLKETDIQLYSIGVGDRSTANLTEQREALRGEMILDELTRLTGGRAFFPVSAAGLEEATSRISRELRQQYSLSYTPTNVRRDGRWRKIKVRLNRASEESSLVLRARAGYYPNQ
jgi:Ca-activated chloride channel homolog